MLDKLAYKKTKELDEKKASKWHSGWFKPTLINGATEVDGYDVEYCMDDFGIVHLKGRLIMKSQATAFALPVGFRPIKTIVYRLATGVSGSSEVVRAQMTNTATGFYVYGNSAGYIELGGISYATR